MDRQPAHFTRLDENASRVMDALERLRTNSTSIRDNQPAYYKVSADQIRSIVRQLRHAAEVVETLLDKPLEGGHAIVPWDEPC